MACEVPPSTVPAYSKEDELPDRYVAILGFPKLHAGKYWTLHVLSTGSRIP
jgi:hypothetical protein